MPCTLNRKGNTKGEKLKLDKFKGDFKLTKNTKKRLEGWWGDETSYRPDLHQEYIGLRNCLVF